MLLYISQTYTMGIGESEWSRSTHSTCLLFKGSLTWDFSYLFLHLKLVTGSHIHKSFKYDCTCQATLSKACSTVRHPSRLWCLWGPPLWVGLPGVAHPSGVDSPVWPIPRDLIPRCGPSLGIWFPGVAHPSGFDSLVRPIPRDLIPSQ